jgi:hypothetical protein
MAQILWEHQPCNQLQVVHFRITRDFDEGQGASPALRVEGYNVPRQLVSLP